MGRYSVEDLKRIIQGIERAQALGLNYPLVAHRDGNLEFRGVGRPKSDVVNADDRLVINFVPDKNYVKWLKSETLSITEGNLDFVKDYLFLDFNSIQHIRKGFGTHHTERIFRSTSQTVLQGYVDRKGLVKRIELYDSDFEKAKKMPNLLGVTIFNKETEAQAEVEGRLLIAAVIYLSAEVSSRILSNQKCEVSSYAEVWSEMMKKNVPTAYEIVTHGIEYYIRKFQVEFFKLLTQDNLKLKDWLDKVLYDERLWDCYSGGYADCVEEWSYKLNEREREIASEGDLYLNYMEKYLNSSLKIMPVFVKSFSFDMRKAINTDISKSWRELSWMDELYDMGMFNTRIGELGWWELLGQMGNLDTSVIENDVIGVTKEQLSAELSKMSIGSLDRVVSTSPKYINDMVNEIDVGVKSYGMKLTDEQWGRCHLNKRKIKSRVYYSWLYVMVKMYNHFYGIIGEKSALLWREICVMGEFTVYAQQQLFYTLGASLKSAPEVLSALSWCVMFIEQYHTVCSELYRKLYRVGKQTEISLKDIQDITSQMKYVKIVESNLSKSFVQLSMSEMLRETNTSLSGANVRELEGMLNEAYQRHLLMRIVNLDDKPEVIRFTDFYGDLVEAFTDMCSELGYDVNTGRLVYIDVEAFLNDVVSEITETGKYDYKAKQGGIKPYILYLECGV